CSSGRPTWVSTRAATRRGAGNRRRVSLAVLMAGCCGRRCNWRSDAATEYTSPLLSLAVDSRRNNRDHLATREAPMRTCRILLFALLVLAWFLAVPLRAADPTDNPIATFYSGSEGYPAWTDTIRWSQIINMKTYTKGKTDYEK